MEIKSIDGIRYSLKPVGVNTIEPKEVNRNAKISFVDEEGKQVEVNVVGTYSINRMGMVKSYTFNVTSTSLLDELKMENVIVG